MPVDASGPVYQQKAPDLWRIPEILGIEVRRRQFDPPRRVTTKGVDRDVREAIEIEIRVSEPFAVRALGPVLWVGDEPLAAAEGDGKNVYRFFSFDPGALKANAEISLGWNTASAPREKTPYRYQPPSK
jgi:hypothetical protein